MEELAQGSGGQISSDSVIGKRYSISEDLQLEEPRNKRVKAEHAIAVPEGQTISQSAGVGEEDHGEGAYDASEAPNAPLASLESSGAAEDGAPTDGSSRIAETAAGNSLALVTPDVDFSSAPSDPVELALWVAQQISHFQQPGVELAADLEEPRSASHSPALSPDPSHGNEDPERALDRARQRLENRERKKRWRESNAERNKDNDLRCRINKRAKQLWGSQQSAERYAWMEAEFNKRRAKRESKDKGRALEDGVEGFGQNSSLGDALFPTPGTGPQGETNAAGVLLANALLGAGNGQGPNTEAAKALKAALERGTVDPRPFTEALRAMAANAEIMGGINALLEQTPAVDDQIKSGEDGGSATQPSAATAGQVAQDVGVALVHEDTEENAIVKALNAATAMLNQMNEARQGDDTSGEGDGDTTGSHDQDALSGAPSLNNRAENEASAGAGQDSTDVEPSNNISAALQQIVQQVLSQTGGPEGQTINDNARSDAEPGAPLPPEPPSSASMLNHELYGLAGDSASALSTLLQYAGAPINTIIPAAQGQATSQLYAQVSQQHSQSAAHASFGINGGSATNGRFNTAQAQTYDHPSTLMNNPGGVSQPSPIQGHSHPSTVPHASPPPPPPSFTSLPMKSTGPILGPGAPPSASQRPPKPKRTAEQEMKAKSFGFPPLPGKRIGMKNRK